MTSTPNSYLSSLNVPAGSSHVTCCDSDEGSDDDDSDKGSDDGDLDKDFDDGSSDEGSLADNPEDTDIDDIELAGSFDDQGDEELERWFAAIQRDPLKRARRLVSFLRSSSQRKEGLSNLIKKGNASHKFIGVDKGKHFVITVPQLELLKDVRTRWDSVFLMLQRLRHLRPVGLSL
jgi:hypothetical protein